MEETKGKISFGFKKAVPSIGCSAPIKKASSSSSSSSSSKVPLKSAGFFDDDDDDQADGARQERERGNGKKNSKIGASLRGNLTGVAGAAPLSRSAKQRTEEALNVDSSVFDYDGVYDSMKVGERQAQLLREEEKKKRDPKYISAFMASSEQRKLDRTRAEAKMIQRERELEGEEFKDVEAFVTDAYKVQMEEIRQNELKEQELEKDQREKSKGVAGFYKNFIEENDRVRQAVINASLQSKPSIVEGKEEKEEVEESEEKAKLKAIEEARKKGLNVRLNDDNEVVDERSLLSAGLNTFGGKKKATLGTEEERSSQERTANRNEHETSRRDGVREAREAREAQRRRQTKMIEEQMLELERKKEEEAQREEEEGKKALIKEKRNDQNSISNARERALERKRKREQEELQRKKTVT